MRRINVKLTIIFFRFVTVNSDIKSFNLFIMKNLKKISREQLKNVHGGSYEDMCALGNGDVCAQYGLSCGVYMGRNNAVGIWSAFRCM